MTSVLALRCLCALSPTTVCFFTLLLAVQKPLELLLIGINKMQSPIRDLGLLRGKREKKERKQKPGVNFSACGR